MSKWEDTVMSDEEMDARLRKNDYARGAEGYKQVTQVIKEAQAEITGKVMYDEGYKAGMEQEHKVMIGVAVDEGNKAYKAGEKQGIEKGRREVVEFVDSHKCGFEACDMEYQIWQAQKEVWFNES